eukprot:TRINITY_DN860_c0_g1_i12.p1 TRINITY_DN860_c0_g1~~TRINITY_DN860_c0_g1_i12.p1  ORF type:complete len:877 (-),score=152.86 TRINITY_DN860_c0_g1_i12:621-3251(-)
MATTARCRAMPRRPRSMATARSTSTRRTTTLTTSLIRQLGTGCCSRAESKSFFQSTQTTDLHTSSDPVAIPSAPESHSRSTSKSAIARAAVEAAHAQTELASAKASGDPSAVGQADQQATVPEEAAAEQTRRQAHNCGPRLYPTPGRGALPEVVIGRRRVVLPAADKVRRTRVALQRIGQLRMDPAFRSWRVRTKPRVQSKVRPDAQRTSKGEEEGEEQGGAAEASQYWDERPMEADPHSSPHPHPHPQEKATEAGPGHKSEGAQGKSRLELEREKIIAWVKQQQQQQRAEKVEQQQQQRVEKAKQQQQEDEEANKIRRTREVLHRIGQLQVMPAFRSWRARTMKTEEEHPTVAEEEHPRTAGEEHPRLAEDPLDRAFEQEYKKMSTKGHGAQASASPSPSPSPSAAREAAWRQGDDGSGLGVQGLGLGFTARIWCRRALIRWMCTAVSQIAQHSLVHLAARHGRTGLRARWGHWKTIAKTRRAAGVLRVRVLLGRGLGLLRSNADSQCLQMLSSMYGHSFRRVRALTAPFGRWSSARARGSVRAKHSNLAVECWREGRLRVGLCRWRCFRRVAVDHLVLDRAVARRRELKHLKYLRDWRKYCVSQTSQHTAVRSGMIFQALAALAGSLATWRLWRVQLRHEGTSRAVAERLARTTSLSRALGQLRPCRLSAGAVRFLQLAACSEGVLGYHDLLCLGLGLDPEFSTERADLIFAQLHLPRTKLLKLEPHLVFRDSPEATRLAAILEPKRPHPHPHPDGAGLSLEEASLRVEAARTKYGGRLCELQQIFKNIDTDHDNVINQYELLSFGKSLHKIYNVKRWSMERQERFWLAIDTDGDGYISNGEFLDYYRGVIYDIPDDRFERGRADFRRALGLPQ